MLPGMPGDLWVPALSFYLVESSGCLYMLHLFWNAEKSHFSYFYQQGGKTTKRLLGNNRTVIFPELLFSTTEKRAFSVIFSVCHGLWSFQGGWIRTDTGFSQERVQSMGFPPYLWRFFPWTQLASHTHMLTTSPLHTMELAPTHQCLLHSSCSPWLLFPSSSKHSISTVVPDALYPGKLRKC